MKIYHIDSVYTGNNGMNIGLEWPAAHGLQEICGTSQKNTWITMQDCSAPYNSATMVQVSLYLGK